MQEIKYEKSDTKMLTPCPYLIAKRVASAACWRCFCFKDIDEQKQIVHCHADYRILKTYKEFDKIIKERQSDA